MAELPAEDASATRIESVDALTQGTGPGATLTSASSLTGHDVVNRAGDTLGEVQEIMLDLAHGTIAYAVMRSGGFLGIGERLFAIPWRALQLDAERKAFVLDVDKSHFDKAPGFETTHWPTQLNGGEAWHRDVHDHYGTPVYWEK